MADVHVLINFHTTTCLYMYSFVCVNVFVWGCGCGVCVGCGWVGVCQECMISSILRMTMILCTLINVGQVITLSS